MNTHRVTITVCGDSATGKSCIALRLVRSKWTSTYDSTIQDSYSFTRQIDEKPYHFSITDTAGQEEFRGLWMSSIQCSDAFLLVYDITRPESLDVLEEFSTLIDKKSEIQWRESEKFNSVAPKLDDFNMTRSAKSMQSTIFESWKSDNNYGRTESVKTYRKPIKVLIGNMCDLPQKRQVSSETGMKWARRHGCSFMETSAKNIINIEETLELTVRQVMEARKGDTIKKELYQPLIQGNLWSSRYSIRFGTRNRFERLSSCTGSLLDNPLIEDNVIKSKEEKHSFNEKNEKNRTKKRSLCLRWMKCSRDLIMRRWRPAHCF